ncbi:MAG: asparaginase [Halopseudomonas aestusnigri]
MPYDLLVEVTRNGIVESRHFGAAAVCDYKGAILESWGDIDNLVFPRSALKPLLAIDVVQSGASDHYALDDAELSLMCASHQGEEMHEKKVWAWLKRLGLSTEHLACGSVLPDDQDNAHKLIASGRNGCRLHHNCSGKHAGFLTTTLHLNMPLKDYHLAEHPVQRRALASLSKLAGTDIKQYPSGIDGCDFPAPTMPLLCLARIVARFSKPENLSRPHAKAIYRLHEAITREPFYAAGHGTLVSELIQVTKGKVLAKTGAEGILTAALPKQGLGIALKISDGNARARSVALLAILDHLGVLSDHEKILLKTHMAPQLKNSRDLIIGEIRPAQSWLHT